MNKPKMKVTSYVRDLSLLGPDKFNEFDRLIQNAAFDQSEAVLIATPKVLADTYEELTQNLSKLASANLMLIVVPPTDTPKPKHN